MLYRISLRHVFRNYFQAFLFWASFMPTLHFFRSLVTSTHATLCLVLAKLLPSTTVVPCCSGYHYCITSFNQAWTQVLLRFKSCSRHVRNLRWWELQGSRLEIRLDVFPGSSIPQEQVTNIIITSNFRHLHFDFRFVVDDQTIASLNSVNIAIYYLNADTEIVTFV